MSKAGGGEELTKGYSRMIPTGEKGGGLMSWDLETCQGLQGTI